MQTTTTENTTRACTMCNATGEIVERDHYCGRYFTSTRECMVCRGSGSIVTEVAVEIIGEAVAA